MTIFQNRFVRSVLLLASSTAAAQAIGMAILPLLTRLYTPEEFGALAAYVSLVGIFSTAACLRFDIAIPLAKTRQQAIVLLVLAVSSCLGTSLMAAGVTWLLLECFAIHKLEAVRAYWWLVPAGVFSTGLYSAVQFFATRDKQFRLVAKTRLSQAIAGALCQLLFGVFAKSTGAFGLMLGQTINGGAGVLGLAPAGLARMTVDLFRRRKRRFVQVFRRYKDFPRYSTFEALANSAGIQIPIILIVSISSPAEGGFVMVAMKLMQAPMRLIGASIGQVFLSEAAVVHRRGELRQFLAKTIAALVKAGFPPILLVSAVFPMLVRLLFGESWNRVGEIVIWMTPWFLAQFIVSPIAMTLHIIDRQRSALLLQLFGLIFRTAGVVIPAAVALGFMTEAYAVSGFVFYLVYFYWIVRSAGVKPSDFQRA